MPVFSRSVSLESHGGRRLLPFRGHSTVVTGIATHPSSCAISFSHIFLSSSLDWTVRLWSVRDHHTPLHTFDDYSECVYGVDWSPIHPALFVAVDGSGRLDVWNLIEDIEVCWLSQLIPCLDRYHRFSPPCRCLFRFQLRDG